MVASKARLLSLSIEGEQSSESRVLQSAPMQTMVFLKCGMPDPIVIDKRLARRFLLAHLHLLPPRRLHGKQGVLDYVRQVNCIQYDPINAVGQNARLVLQSRVGGFRPSMLDALLYEDRRLIDGFDKQMSIYPAEDWPLFTYYRQQMARKYMEDERTAAAAKLVDRVRTEIEERGPAFLPGSGGRYAHGLVVGRQRPGRAHRDGYPFLWR